MRSFLGGLLLGAVVASSFCLVLMRGDGNWDSSEKARVTARRATNPEESPLASSSPVAAPAGARQSVSAADLELAEAIEPVDYSFKSDPAWIENQRRLRVVAGLDTRETIGDAAADEVIFEHARKTFTEMPGTYAEIWRSELMGFASTDELAAFEDSILTRSSTVQSSFAKLSSAADGALIEYQEALNSAWEARRYLQVSEPGGSLRSSEEWRAEQGVDSWPKSVLRKSHRAQIADRMFRFHFFSYEYPQAELRYNEAKRLAGDLHELLATD